MVRRAFLLLVGTVALAGCDASGGPASTAFPMTLGESNSLAAAPLTPAPSGTVSGGALIALLAPLSGPNAERGQALVQAAQLALAQPGSPHLDVRDTGGTAAGAAAAAQAAIVNGAGLLIGPLTAAETSGAAAPARAAGVPVLAFTNDTAQAQPGVWTLGITPAQQMRRLVGAVLAQGKMRFAAVLPPTPFGQAVATALSQATAAAAAPPANIHVHDGTNPGIASALRDVSGYSDRRGAFDARIKAARARHDAAGRQEATELSREDVPPAPFDALVLADTGERLAWAASFLEYYDIQAPDVRLLGPALWASPAGRGGATLSGAWYAAPDPASRQRFDQDYQATFGSPAPGLADFAFDAAAIGRVLAQGGGFSAASLCRPEGFAGVDGVMALEPGGSVRRGLAVFEIEHGSPSIVDPAPTTLSSPAI